ncbi:4Fe-4S dicluster domain-containing protein [Clostridium beijerinckii]|uniref:Adenylylsulfate reductase subunit B n=1 Tax=Clostridium beijerinckii TaxID=1520 RepID=A0AAX0B3B5_CLOBE|nr:ferredoxin family protein [Clostridium beijerinckii]NRT88929.1 adenylylsulfate reductase subunit B [Clostridium beijerinckii]NYC74384.1 adenylylsulfate reductase subunit B [Clostridium beijerinckii]
MSIAISKEKCIGCKKCLSVCPGNLIKPSDDGKVYMKYLKDCWGCSSCIKECPTSSISLYLGADVGGRGSRMTVQLKDDFAYWKIEESNGTEHSIDINRKYSNQY